MVWAGAIVALGLSAAAGAGAPPSDQTMVFYNARMALRDDRPEDVLKLWLIHNDLQQKGERGQLDNEFRSVVWAALGKLGLCQDGYPNDEQSGAGLWPLSLHNLLVQGMSKGKPPGVPPPFDVFEVGRQQRLVSLFDVLSAEELRSVTFHRTPCLLPVTTMMSMGESPLRNLEDRLQVGLLLKALLQRSLDTLVRAKVQNVSVVEARIFDLDLALLDLQARQLRRDARSAAQRARSLGVSKVGAAELRSQTQAWPEGSEQAVFLRRSLTWKTREWMALSKERRLYLFSQARQAAEDLDNLERFQLAMIDELISRGQGEELESWLGFFDAKDSPDRRDLITRGDRGKRLLELEPSTGFRERPVVAMQRGVAFLEAGDRQESLRSFAWAMQHAEESREADAIVALSRRWLSFVLARFETTDEVLSTLKTLVPKQEFNPIIEDLVWRAALRADAASFERVTKRAQGGGSFDSRIERLGPLAAGKPGEMATRLREGLKTEPWAALKFTRQLVEKLESEDGDVRKANVATLKRLREVLERFAAEADSGTSKAHRSAADELQGRIESMLDGLNHLEVSEPGARSLSPGRETFAGNIRLAPADAIPWPFRAPEPVAPNAFTQIVLQPVEWRDPKGDLVFGWRITE